MSSAAIKKARFEFGRHETFAVRHGWLGKGMARIEEADEGFKADLDTADALGIGSRMVKSLQFWLDASGMAVFEKLSDAKRRARRLVLSPLGRAVMRHDPYLEFPATWWFIHLNLASRPGSVWSWFFNDFRERTFERAACVDAFIRHLKEQSSNQPTPDVAKRDVGCLLLAYAAGSANDRVDPEDPTICPLRDLALVLRHSDTGRFEKTRPLDQVPLEVVLACISQMASDSSSDSVPIGEMIRRRFGPARIFSLSGDMIDEITMIAEQVYGEDGVRVSLLGAERHLTIPPLRAHEWFERHFQRIGEDQ